MKRVISPAAPFAALPIVFAACAPDVPDAPSYQQDIAPIFAANCVRCHGVPVLGGAPSAFRLDAYNDYEIPLRNGVGTETIAGAATYSLITTIRVDDDDRPMPPRFSLDGYQIDTLKKWHELGAPRGAPRSNNRPPTATITNIQKAVSEDGIDVRVHYLIDIDVRDPDPDIVGGGLAAHLGATVLPVGLLRSGSNRVAWETTNIARATFRLVARLDDGAEEIAVQLGTLDVEGP